MLEQYQTVANNFIAALEQNSFDEIGFSKSEWMQHYLELWSEEIPLSNGRTLIEEWDNLQAKLEPPGPAELEEMRRQSEQFGQPFTQKDEDEVMASAKRRKAKILGPINVEEMPADIFEHQVRRCVGMSYHEWEDLSPHTKGYEMALYAVNNMIEGIKNYHQQEDLRAKQEQRNQNRPNRKPGRSNSRSRPPKRRRR